MTNCLPLPRRLAISHLILTADFDLAPVSLSPVSFFAAFASQIRQNLRFSSAAPVATVHPSGLSAVPSTRWSCAGTSYIFWREGYDQREMLCSGKPWVERISLEWGDQMREVTWEAVGREEVRAPVDVVQKWMCLSAEPPPVARREDCQGHQARA